MKPDSVRSLKAALSASIVADHGDGADAVSFFAATEPPMPCGLGISLGANGEHLLAIRTEDKALAGRLAVLANGEADVRIMRVEARVSAGELQGSRRPLEPGAQVQIRGTSFVGTLGALVRDADGVLYALSNSHVLADVGATPIGTVIGQPWGAQPIGVLARHIPLSRVSPNLVDCAIARLDHTEALIGWNAALGGQLTGHRAIRTDDLGRTVTKVGRTTGVTRGAITAIEVDGLPVNYGTSGVMTFNDQIEVSGGPTSDFSAGGDSGSLIVDDDGMAIALLFAGGVSNGIDHTFGNYAVNVFNALGVGLAI